MVNFDLESKRLTDVAEPMDKTDAATRNYVNNTDNTTKLYMTERKTHAL